MKRYTVGDNVRLVNAPFKYRAFEDEEGEITGTIINAYDDGDYEVLGGSLPLSGSQYPQTVHPDNLELI